MKNHLKTLYDLEQPDYDKLVFNALERVVKSPVRHPERQYLFPSGDPFVMCKINFSTRVGRHREKEIEVSFQDGYKTTTHQTTPGILKFADEMTGALNTFFKTHADFPVDVAYQTERPHAHIARIVFKFSSKEFDTPQELQDALKEIFTNLQRAKTLPFPTTHTR